MPPNDEGPKPSLHAPLHNTSSPRDKEPAGFDKLLKWQDERRARRLRGEYESAVTRLSEVINGNLDAPLSIASVRVEGATHTRASFLASLIQPALSASPAPPSPTLQSTLHTTRSISSTLNATGLFSSLTCTLVPPSAPSAPSSTAPIPAVDLLIRAKERGRYFLSSSTELGNAEGTASAVARVRNVFGGAETFEANVSMGTKTRRAFRATLSAPVVLGGTLGTQAEVGVYAMDRDLTAYASCMEDLRGVKASVKHTTPTSGAHELAYDAVVRHVASLAPTASLSMRQSAGTSLKSALSHTFVYDTRDDRLAASRGFYLKTTSELAGARGWLGGDAEHTKFEVEAQVSRRVAALAGAKPEEAAGDSWWKSLSLALSWRSGVLWGLRGEDDSKEKTLFSDRFQLGGPTSVRGFVANGMGPRDGADSLGGSIYYAAGASVTGDIPGKPHWPVKTHLWANAGRLDVVDQSHPLAPQLPPILARPALSAGLGLVYRLDPVRVEVNVGAPLALSQGEKGRRGVQVGVGIEFV